MTPIFKPGDRVYFPIRNKWVTLKDASTSDLKNILELEGEGIYIDPTFAISLINPYDPSDPNNPPEFRVSRWISVDERLPEEGVEVIVYNKGGGVIPDISYVKGRWVWDAGIVKNVTHWMPLPKGPEDK